MKRDRVEGVDEVNRMLQEIGLDPHPIKTAECPRCLGLGHAMTPRGREVCPGCGGRGYYLPAGLIRRREGEGR